MDHVHLLNQIRDRKNIERAFQYANYDRLNTDYYFDFFEMRYVNENRDSIINEVLTSLNNPDKYIPIPAYDFFPPKSDLCYRRMIYIPFKDLVIRYAFVSIFADYLDNELSNFCFANRRASDDRSKYSLLEDFSTQSWPKFCAWQRECVKESNILLRTDISAFYDSISHDYLIKQIAKELSINEETEVIQLFKKILSIPVISYSNFTKIVQPLHETKQGLAIGNNTDGFLANLFLKDVDELMNNIQSIKFGRYNDDMRIFGNDRGVIFNSILTLQQKLLTKGLNLNSGKSRIAENKEQIENLRSKLYEIYYYHDNDNETSEEDKIEEKPNVANEIDVPLDEFHETFKPDFLIENNEHAKKFCKFLNSKTLLPYKLRTPEYINKLEEILRKWHGSGKSACWLIIQTIFWKDFSEQSKKIAIEILFRSLSNTEVSTYCKYRLLHHLIKIHGRKEKYRYLDKLNDIDKEKLIRLIPSFISQPAFELNIAALYLLNILGNSEESIREYVKTNASEPIGDPIKNALSYIKEPIEIHETPANDNEFEPDSLPDCY